MKACVFAHYDADRLLDDYLKPYLTELAGLFSRIIFVSTSGVDPAGLSFLSGLGIEVIARENDGYDFQSYKVGIERLLTEGESWDSLLIANDSCYGPLFPLREVFSAMEGSASDFWGMTRCDNPKPHIQSYFVLFEKKAVEAEAFRKFWAEMRPLSSRQEVIEAYEIGLSAKLGEAGLGMGCYLKTKGARNPSLTRPRSLLRRRVPLMKISLLKDNPWGANISNIEAEISERSAYSFTAILKHLARITKKDSSEVGQYLKKNGFRASVRHWLRVKRERYLPLSPSKTGLGKEPRI